MIPVACPRARRRLLGLLAGIVVAAGVAARAAEGDPSGAGAGFDLPPGLEIEWQGTLKQTDDGGAMFTGPVTMTWKETRIQADQLLLRDRRHVEAEGNVLIAWGQNRVFGSRIHYDLDEERGVIEDAIGYALDEYLIWAGSIEKIGDKTLRLSQATVTTCNQPLPYWSFRVSSATVTLERYARMWNVRLHALHVPVIYLPYLMWPVKEERAAGLLMPEFSTTQQRGNVVSQPLFIPLGRSADLTLIGRYYTEAGFMGGSEVRFIPNLKGGGVVGGFFIDDAVAGRERYRFDYRQTQEFRNGFRMVADVGLVSDSQYYTDFERDLNLASAPQSLARLEFSRNGRWTSLNVRELRREQLGSGLVQSTYPEIEWRARSRKLGPTPLYLSVESSAASIQQDNPTTGLDADYYRGDLFPELTLPYSPSPWFDIAPRVAYRWTHWTQHETSTGGLVNEGLTRSLLTYSVELVGPKVYRIFGKADDRRGRYKHTVEPRLSYGFDEEFERIDDVLSYDEIDRLRGAGTRATYALVQRLFARRPQIALEPPRTLVDSVVLPDGSTHEADSEAEAPSAPDAEVRVPVEIASLEVRQARSFDSDLTSADLDGDGLDERTSPYSDLILTGRVNPSQSVSVDVRSNYHILYDQLRDVSVSGLLRNRWSSAQISFLHRNGLGVNASTLAANEDSTQVQFGAQLQLLRDRMRLKLRTAYDGQPAPGESRFPEKRWQVLYGTQCCTMLVESLTREFGGAEDRREFHFRIDLRGVGKLVETTF
jgi:hypothetical protein